MSDQDTQVPEAVEAVALFLAGEDGDLEDFPTNAGGIRDYQIERAQNIVAVARPPIRAELAAEVKEAIELAKKIELATMEQMRRLRAALEEAGA